MPRLIEPFARNAMMADVRLFTSGLREPVEAASQLNQLFSTIVASPAFDGMYLEYLEGLFEDIFEQNEPLEPLMEDIYKEDISKVRDKIADIRFQYASLFSPTVRIETNMNEERSLQSMYKQALELLEVIDILDQETADPDPPEREIRAREFVSAINQGLRAHLQEKGKIAVERVQAQTPAL